VSKFGCGAGIEQVLAALYRKIARQAKVMSPRSSVTDDCPSCSIISRFALISVASFPEIVDT